MRFVNRQSKYKTGLWHSPMRMVAEALFADEPVCRLWQKEQITPGTCVSFTGPVSIRKENRIYRRIDQVTDVLSFPMLDMKDGSLCQPLTDADLDNPFAPIRSLFLGDILICVDQAMAQAGQFDHSLEREMTFLFLHGLLHLLGYDHENEQREKLMIKRQNDLMNRVGILR